MGRAVEEEAEVRQGVAARGPVPGLLRDREPLRLRLAHAGLIALGLSSITVPRFLILNFIGAGIWAGLFTTIGYVFGYSITSVFLRLEQMEHGVMIGLAILLGLLGLFFAWQQGGSVVRDKLFSRGRDDDDGEALEAVRSQAPTAKREPKD